MLRNLAQRSDRAFVTLDRDHLLCAFGEKRARQSSRSGADLQHRDAIDWTGSARNASGEIEVEQEILTERLAGGKFVATDDFAQRRQSIGRTHFAAANVGAATSRAASLSAAVRLA